MKKFEITKEQIKTIEADGCTYVKEWFPDAFKKKLIIGKWYKAPYGSLICFTGDLRKSYGISNFGNWFNDDWVLNQSELIEATPQEVESALICEATKRYANGVIIQSLYDYEAKKIGNCIQYYNETNCLWSNGVKLFDNGKWAEIIETITIQEAEKLLQTHYFAFQDFHCKI